MCSYITSPTSDRLVQVSGRLVGGRVEVSITPGWARLPCNELAVRLAVQLAQPERKTLRRSGWIAWGSVAPDNTLAPAKVTLVNGLPPGPCVGQIWYPDDHIPAVCDDATINVATVATLEDAVHALELFAAMEDAFFEAEGLRGRDRPAVLGGASALGPPVVETYDLGASQWP